MSIQIDTTIDPGTQSVKPDTDAMSSMETPKRIGLTLFVLIFGVFGIWSALAPLDGAANAPGVVTVRSYEKIIQHLEGGIVRDILARNGDFVSSGDPLLILDDTQAKAQLEIANTQLTATLAIEARLRTERDGLDQVEYPDSLLNGGDYAAQEMASQNQIFTARKAAYEGGIEVLEQRIEQLQSRKQGLEALKASKEKLAASFSTELEDLQEPLSRGFATITRVRELERNIASLEGEAAELLANISSTDIETGEARLQIIQQQNEFQNQVVNQLGEAQTSIKDLQERIIALNDIVSRTVVRAPEDGIINGMQVHTIGGVIGPGSVIAELVPQSDELVIEARVSPNDIDQVAIGQEANIRFSAFGRATVPTIYGTVISLSADSLQDETTGAAYYQARIEVAPESLADIEDLVLVPGMPAEAFINTGSRTFLQYLFRPLTNAMARAFNEE